MSFHPIEGGGVLYSAEQGRLYALNPVACLSWLCVQDHLSTDDSISTISDTFNIDSTSAAELFSESIKLFQSSNLIGSIDQQGREHGKAEGLAESPSHTKLHSSGTPYRLLDQTFFVAAPKTLQPIVDSFLASLRVDLAEGETPRGFDIEIAIHGEILDIFVDGTLATSCSIESVAAEIERLVVKRVVPATPHLVTFHAAAVQRDGRPFLLAGESGSGKTTLSLALARSGWDFGSDEIVLLCRDLRLRPLPLPACSKANVMSTVMQWFPEIESAREHDRYGKKIRYLPMRSATFQGKSGFVIFPRYDLAGPNALQVLDGFSGLQRLLGQCVFVPPGFKDEDVKLLLLWHSRQQYFEVHYNHCDFAVSFLTDIDAQDGSAIASSVSK